MSTLNLENIKHPDSASNNISVDSSGRVGIGTSSPTRTLDVRGFISGSDGTTTTEIVNGGGVGYVGTKSNHPLSLQTNNVGRVNVDTSGRVTMPYQPSFYTYNMDWPSASAGVAVGGTVGVNIGNHYNSANGRFTCPINGVYEFLSLMQGYDSGQTYYASIHFRINGTTYGGQGYSGFASQNHALATTSIIVSLQAGDYVQAGTDYGGRDIQNYFSGKLIG